MKPSCKPIFWTCCDTAVLEFIDANRVLQDLSREYDFYFMCSGTSLPRVRELYRGHHIKCINDFCVKANTLFTLLRRRNDYDVVIRVDMDAILFNVPDLLNRAQAAVDAKVIIGNQSPDKRYDYIRGGCNISSRAVIETIGRLYSDNPLEFDPVYSDAAVAAGAVLDRQPIFEESLVYGGTAPTWHPLKYGGNPPTIAQFKTNIAGYVKPEPVAAPAPAPTGNKIPKHMHFFWGDSPMSWMRYMTLQSFCKTNPDWETTLHTSAAAITKKPWHEHNTQDFFNYTGEDYRSRLSDLPINIETDWKPPAGFSETPINVCASHQSNFFKWTTLATQGGWYSDMDILFVKSLNPLAERMEDRSVDTGICFDGRSLLIGFMCSTPDNRFFADIAKAAHESYNVNNYQCAGVHAAYAAIYGMEGRKKMNGAEILQDIESRYPYLELYSIPTQYVYPWYYNSLDKVYQESHDLPEDTLGIHWYGGDPLSQKYNSVLTDQNYGIYKSTFCRYAREVIPIDARVAPVKDTEIKLIRQPVFAAEVEPIPKHMHLFWGSSPLSWLRYLTLESFCKTNPDWKVTLHTSSSCNDVDKPWGDANFQDFFAYTGPDYMPLASKLPITVDSNWGPPAGYEPLPDTMGPSHKSNFFKWMTLAEQGGWYADFDILFLRSLNQLHDKVTASKATTGMTFDGTNLLIGFMFSVPNNPFFREVAKHAYGCYNPAKYQCVGGRSIYWMLYGTGFGGVIGHRSIWDDLTVLYPDCNFYNIPMHIVYPWPHNRMRCVFERRYNMGQLNEETVGVHWFGGCEQAQQYNNEMLDTTIGDYDNTFTILRGAQP